MGPSLRDVAARAGVSVKTVSNVVNDHPHVSAATRARVQALLDEMGYRPHLLARRLRAGRSGIIALAIPSLEVPYFAELARTVFDAAERRGLQVLIDQTDADRTREQESLTGLRTGLIDGVLLSPLSLRPGDLSARSRRIPVVLLGERFFGPRVADVEVDHVAVDNVAAAREATAHLVGLGRRRIAFLGGQRSARAMVDLRLQGWSAALAEAGLRTDLRQPTPGFGRHDGLGAMDRMLDDSDVAPDAVFCANDLLALGALRALATRRIRVPDDLAVCGFDDLKEGWFSNPTLTSVAPDKEAIAEIGVERLLDRINGTAEPAVDTRVGYRLAVRESTGGPGAEKPPPTESR